MNLEFYNCPSPEKINLDLLPKEVPFLGYEPDFELMQKLAEDYKQYKNLLVIGNGGSVNSFSAIYFPLKYQASKKVYFLSTVDPDFIFELKGQLKVQDTLVLAISKSGENITLLEACAQFVEYKMLFITGKSSTLRAMGEKLGVRIFEHPPIGGRFNSFTEVGLLPAALCGIDVKNLYGGAMETQKQYAADNLAWRAATVLYNLEQKGFVDVFMPFYSHSLFPSSFLIVQLCHESFGKQGKGQTYFAHEAPESQHHTNQRFFGGRKNICGFFFTAQAFQNQITVEYPAQTHSLQIRGRHLADINKISLAECMRFEALGTMEDARIQAIPFLRMTLSGFSAAEIGRFIAFWQLCAVYGSVLRQVDPFNQPQVENSKNISFDKRLQYKGLL